VKTLIVNADDFGFTPDVNAGIVHACREGILRATTLMANGKAFEDAVRLASQTPALEVGCHFVLAGDGNFLAAPGTPVPRSVAALAAAVYQRRIDLEAELTAQLRRITNAGINPLHLDTHKHTHLLPPVLRSIAAVAHNFGVRFLRRPFDLPMGMVGIRAIPFKRRPTALGMQLLRGHFARVLSANGYAATDYFAGFQITGTYRTDDLVNLLRHLPEGSTELMTHPGFLGDDLKQARTRLKETRLRELEALTAPAVLRTIKEEGIRVSGYRQLLEDLEHARARQPEAPTGTTS
jgi:chitin disaccharide deacetylase